jgi:uncharacterized protein
MSPATKRVEVEASGGVRLVGVLARPAGSDDAPAALLLSGSGPLDHDSNMPGQILDISRALASARRGRRSVSSRRPP